MIDQAQLDAEIQRLLDILYKKRFEKLAEIDLKRLLKKNPFLFRSVGIQDPNELIEAMLDAFLSSSDETIFGNDFFEPLAYWTATAANKDKKDTTVSIGSASGMDIAIETANAFLAIAVKSGTNIFNAQSTKGQSAEFRELQARLRKMGKEIRPIVGYGYGRHKAKTSSSTEKHAGQAFWQLISGEDDFYLRISDSIGKYASEHKEVYAAEYIKTKSRLLRQLALNFVDEDGTLNWQKIFKYNSGIERPEKLKG